MKRDYVLNNETRKYLGEFYDILGNMIEGMTGASLSDSISGNFIAQMIPHHKAAVEMSKNVLEYSQDEEVIKIAKNIITTQTKGIEALTAAADRCGEVKNGGDELYLYARRFGIVTDIMFRDMGTAYTDNDISGDFMREMIPHHLGAVRMSENALRFELCQELIPVIEEIIITQNQGIREMERLLREA